MVVNTTFMRKGRGIAKHLLCFNQEKESVALAVLLIIVVLSNSTRTSFLIKR